MQLRFAKLTLAIALTVAPPALAVQVKNGMAFSASDQFVCGVKNSSIYCWGDGSDYYELGTGRQEVSWIPEINWTADGITAVATGYNHACVVVQGYVYCWGNNDYGEIGNGTNDVATTPTWISGVPYGDNSDVGAGGYFSCALVRSGTSGGGPYCWGRNYAGQLGDGTTSDRSYPVHIKSPPVGFVGLAVGDAHACAITTDHAVFCWGRNDSGQLGDGSTSDRSVPVIVRSPIGTGVLSNIIEISAGSSHTCAITSTGVAYCWGNNARGQLGNGTTTNSSLPVQVTSTLKFASISLGKCFSGATITSGQPFLWGCDDAGQVDRRPGADVYLPTAIAFDYVVKSITSGSESASVCAVEDYSGHSKCWGEGRSGQLGDDGGNSTWVIW